MEAHTLTPRQTCDLEMILNGAFAPLTGFLTKEEHCGVVENMRLPSGALWPMPINLELPDDLAGKVEEGDSVELLNPEGAVMATIEVQSKWQPNKDHDAKQVFGTSDENHPGVAQMMAAPATYIGGPITEVEGAIHYTFQAERHTPAELKAEFERRNWTKIVAFQTRNPLHRAHVEMVRRAMKEADAHLVLNPVVGLTKPGDVGAFSRVRCYRAVMNRFPEGLLSLLPLAMRMGGPREAVWHGLIRKNYGFTHFVVGRDHAGPGNDSNGEPFYGPYDAQELFQSHQAEMGIEMVPFRFMAYVPERGEYMEVDQIPDGCTTENISGTELRRRLREGSHIPEWFSYPEVLEELRREYPPRDTRGFTLFFTGLSGAGKSTIANALVGKLMELGTRPVTLLDGDIVRKNLSSELGFSKEHRDLNIQRIGFVASEITKNKGIAVCAPIAPYDATRKSVRGAIEQVGDFILIHVATSLEECERRDRKGLYDLARKGVIKEFTGISDPYEAPADAELVVPTEGHSPEDCADVVYRYLVEEGYI